MTAPLPDRNDSDIPPQVQCFLSVCELTVCYNHWLRENLRTEKSRFYEGVVDYWWDHDTLDRPTMDMLRFSPSDNRIAYQKGAILGYRLAELFKEYE